MPEMNSWFPKGKEDPSINLLKVEISKAEYWDKESNRMVQMVGCIKTIVPDEHYHTVSAKG
jgi:general stress protein 26